RAENALRNVQGKKLFGEELWKVFTPKMRSEEKVISEKLGILGVVDAIKEYDDELIPIEMKTGSAPKEGVWPAHKLQLAAYMSILSSANKKRVKKGIIKYIDESIERQIILNPFMEEEIHKKILAVNMTLQGRLPGFTDNKNKCRMCGLRETCYDEERMGDLVEKRMLKNS
ncbi:MAG: CRISPR-associated protein Cas4, partial [Nanoarchaeota archaeon]|nr:CRISPR-associated protein Cas4 [Nanoarchaeota archaeon]